MDFKRGINIGDHFEVNPPLGVPFENPIGADYFDSICSLGFDHVRLPVRWSAHTDDAHGYAIDKPFFSMVRNTVDKFLAKGLTVILNVHHFTEAADDPRANYDKLAAIWEQLGTRFCGYSDRLVFELLNEPHNCDPDELNDVYARLTALIRRTNPTRKILIGGVSSSSIASFKTLVPPTGDGNIIATFHYYNPFYFTHQGAHWASLDHIHGVRWNGTDEEIAAVRRDISVALAWRERFGIPLNLGEFGAYGKYAAMEDRAKWARTVRTACEEAGISWTYWEYNRGFGIRDGQSDRYFKPLTDALLG